MGLRLRLMMVWKAWTRVAAMATGSMPLWGMAAWEPLPVMMISKVLEEARMGPGRMPI